MKKRIVGVDEVGRGPLAGPVTICAVAVPVKRDISFLKNFKDSKKLSSRQREEVVKGIKMEKAVCSISSREIDRFGISKAIKKAVRIVLKKLNIDPKSKIFLDGSLKAPKEYVNQKTIIGGDSKNKLIATASVFAKVHRDRLMTKRAERYPRYGFEIHKGYGTLSHRKAIKKYGLCKEHRRSFTRELTKKI
ncbi:MAG: ribonuclease HII [Candidatus Pacebacteria bacterium]|nr:ribonuclease HII [Candidatus Paceibacterota bacterium]